MTIPAAIREHRLVRMAVPFVARIDLVSPQGLRRRRGRGSATVLPSGALAGDRRWAFVDGKDRFVNGKQFPAIHPIRTRIDPDASTAVFDDLHFRLAGDVTPLEDWLSNRLATPVRLRENPTAGFPTTPTRPGRRWCRRPRSKRSPAGST